jgi:hypothetical protein
MDECENWQKKSYIIQKNCKHSKARYRILALGHFYTCHEFLSRTCKFEKTNSKTCFGRNSLLHDLVSLGNFLSTKLWNAINNFMQLRASKLKCHKIKE